MNKVFFDRSRMNYFPLKDRSSKVDITKAAVMPETILGSIAEQRTSSFLHENLDEKCGLLAAEIKQARKNNSSVICTFGAHAIKNGLGPLLGEMLRKGWFTHLASNGAAVIHDWEFSWLGKSSEDVRENVSRGKFGTWEETGLYINLALAAGAYRGLGYAASVGKMIAGQGIEIPERNELLNDVSLALKAGQENCGQNDRGISEQDTVHKYAEKAAAALDLYSLLENLKIPSGFLSIPHPYRQYSLLASAYELGKPFTCHPMFGHDIIYTHMANRGAVIGRSAEKDFLEFVASVEGLEGGVYLSVGSAVMSPMIFEKAISMARNAFIAENGPGLAAGKNNDASGLPLRNLGIYVIDLQESGWDWSKGEPPMNNPAYYLRYMKSFNRMGCRTQYITADNRDFFISLYRSLESI